MGVPPPGRRGRPPADYRKALTGAVLDAALDCIVVMDGQGLVVEFNSAAVAVFGYERDEVLGREMAELIIPPALRQAHREGLAHYLATGEGPVLGTRFEITGMRADGSEFPVELAITALAVEGEPVFTGYLRDITERKRAERERATLLERERLARLRAERAERRAAFLAEAGAAMGSSLDHATTLERVAELAVPELADWCVVDLEGEGGGHRRMAAASADEVKRELASEVARRYPIEPRAAAGVGTAARTGESALISELSDAWLQSIARDAEHLRLLRGAEFGSVMIVPLVTGGRALGTLTLASSQRGRYGEEDLRTAEELARRAATAIENARLYRSRSDIARTLQQSLLPPVLPELPGCQVAGRYRAAGEANQVGGDFYDLFELAQDRWVMVIGDVSGKGAGAAAVTALARYTLRAAAMRESTPSRMLAVLNDALLSQRGDEELCTVVLATVTPSGAGVRLTLANAGHPRPLVARGDGSVQVAGAHGTALGVSGELAVEDWAVELAAGDTVVFYTDGVMDAHAPALVLDEEELAALLSACRGEGPAACAERLEHAVLEAAAGDPRDDMALLVLSVGSAEDASPALAATATRPGQAR